MIDNGYEQTYVDTWMTWNNGPPNLTEYVAKAKRKIRAKAATLPRFDPQEWDTEIEVREVATERELDIFITTFDNCYLDNDWQNPSGKQDADHIKSLDVKVKI